MDYNIPFFVVDDEEAVILTLKKVISKVYPKSPIFSSSDGLYTLDFIQKNNKPMIVVSDINIPGINGLQIIQKLRSDSIYNDIYFIVITSNIDKEMNLKVLQLGADDFLNKPFSVDQLISKLRSGVKVSQLKMLLHQKDEQFKQLNIELEKSSQKMKELINKYQISRIPEAEKIIDNVKAASLWIAEKAAELDENGLKALEVAVSLCYSGRLFLADRQIFDPIMVNGQVKNDIMAQVPIYSFDFLNNIKGFEDSALILKSVYENFDGSGIPEKIKAWQIPLGARILRVVLDYEEMTQKMKIPHNKVMETMELESKRLYDFRIVALFDQYCAFKGIGSSGIREAIVDRKDLIEGMMLSRSIITESGMKIMGNNTLLTDEKIEKIRTITKTDSVIGSIWIKS